MSDVDRMVQGERVRREVLGASYADPAKTPTAFQAAAREFTISQCWGGVWLRPGLERKTRSMLNLSMLAVMARWHEFEVHVKGALNNGVTPEEIIEICLQAGVYAGVPIAMQALSIADKAVQAYVPEPTA